MEPIRVNRAALSRLIWSDILALTNSIDREVISEPCQYLEINRRNADYNTGSINFTNAWCLYSLVYYFKPRVIAEVGTFIGKSTMAMSEAMQHALVHDPVIYTCDSSNDIKLDMKIDVRLEQFPKMTSTDMFTEMVDKQVKADLVFVDGRLSVEDIELLGQVMHESSVLVFDDFEGVEKGVINVLNLSNLFANGYTLIYPPDMALLLDACLMQPSNLAIIAPFSSLRFVSQ